MLFWCVFPKLGKKGHFCNPLKITTLKYGILLIYYNKSTKNILLGIIFYTEFTVFIAI